MYTRSKSNQITTVQVQSIIDRRSTFACPTNFSTRSIQRVSNFHKQVIKPSRKLLLATEQASSRQTNRRRRDETHAVQYLLIRKSRRGNVPGPLLIRENIPPRRPLLPRFYGNPLFHDALPSLPVELDRVPRFSSTLLIHGGALAIQTNPRLFSGRAHDSLLHNPWVLLLDHLQDFRVHHFRLTQHANTGKHKTRTTLMLCNGTGTRRLSRGSERCDRSFTRKLCTCATSRLIPGKTTHGRNEEDAVQLGGIRRWQAQTSIAALLSCDLAVH